MKPEVMLELLEAAADQLGIRVTYEALQSGMKSAGGLCRVKSEYRIIVDKRATSDERVVTVATALGHFDAAKPGLLEEIALPAKVREVLRTYETASKSTAARKISAA